MVDIKISGRKVSVSDSLREHVEEKIADALKVFDIKPMTCDVVLRVDKNPSNPERKACEVTVFVRDNVVRVVASSDDMFTAIDEAADKVTRQLRKYKTRIIDRRQRMQQAKVGAVSQEDLAALIEPGPEEAPTPEEAAAHALALMQEQGLSPSAAAKAAAQGTPYGKSEIYKRLLALQADSE